MAKVTLEYKEAYKKGKIFTARRNQCPSCWISRHKLFPMKIIRKDRRTRASTLECQMCGLRITKPWNRCKW